MNKNIFMNDNVYTPESNRFLSILSWSIAAILLIFFCLTHLIVMIYFSLNWHASAVVAPIALLLSLLTGSWLARREGLIGWQCITPSLIVITVVGASLFLASKFFDMSWDGLWYH
jgi:hypothetical protein